MVARVMAIATGVIPSIARDRFLGGSSSASVVKRSLVASLLGMTFSHRFHLHHVRRARHIEWDTRGHDHAIARSG